MYTCMLHYCISVLSPTPPMLLLLFLLLLLLLLVFLLLDRIVYSVIACKHPFSALPLKSLYPLPLYPLQVSRSPKAHPPYRELERVVRTRRHLPTLQPHQHR